MKRITIILEEEIYDRLPVKGRSPFINLVLKNHFRQDNAEQLYQYIKQKLLQDGFSPTKNMTTSWDSVVSAPSRCCSLYPDLECGHWYTNDNGQLYNDVTKELSDAKTK